MAINLPTPGLSPSTSVGPSPAFEIIQSPDDTDVEGFDFDLGPAAKEEKDHIPECWGHRGVSGAAENTRASFIEACKAGADGIETDIHITSDNELVMFHDPNLSRTTDGQGRIDSQPWHGVLEHVRTKQSPHQPIPRFTEVLDILMDHPGVKLNLDCKIENEPYKLFGLVKTVIESYPDWATKLAPRIILGLWHPKYIGPASQLLPYLPRYCISMSIPQVRQYFFQHCHGFSVYFEALASADGAAFRAECKAAGKWICSWTVNDKEEMRECVRWGIKSIISDKPALWREVKAEILADRAKALKPSLTTYVLPWSSKKKYWFDYEQKAREEFEYLEKEGGRFDDVIVPELSLRIAKPGDVMSGQGVLA
ncbi:PLC-like phosphodiesterase [Kockovaella imperatae]|uniref:PLC-like phosphodiesterase n=1 Tax=Kockovaella imperatae TaxID=4999 RepID=A0A1Y1UN81_9TREE|nr:PLC-like phosphodiesterase [Kockovaella imperatae]ORX38944.1 PLC-like phosphodiesterase [Kockovaella imperatae]